MNMFQEETGRRLVQVAALTALDDGLAVSPRGLLTHELRPALLRLEDPTDALCTKINRRGLSAEVAALEALQLIAGASTPELLFAAAPSFRKFFNHDEDQFDGAYGPRVGPQMSAVVQRLEADPDTRQAIAVIYDGSDGARPTSRDYPCTLSLHFLVRDEKLCLATTMRSNDAWLGFPYDLFQFTQLQCSVAQVLNREVGDYTHLANSFHVYEPNFDNVDQLGDTRYTADLDEEDSPTEPFHVDHLYGIGRAGMPMHQVQNRALLILRGRAELLNGGPTSSEAWYIEQVTPVIERAGLEEEGEV